MSRFNNILVLCLVISSCSLSAVHARRRSRIDLPIKNAADAPNEAVESVKEESASAAAVSAPQPTTVQADLAESSNDVSEISSSEELQDCDNIDNISFELVTGYAHAIKLSVKIAFTWILLFLTIQICLLITKRRSRLNSRHIDAH